MTRSALALALLASTGCAAPYFVGQTGRVTPKRALQVQLGYGYNVATSAADVVNDGKTLSKNLQATDQCGGQASSCYTAASFEPIVDAAYRLALVSPLSSHAEVSVRYGLPAGFDVGGHLGTQALRLDAGWQAFGPRDPRASGWAGSVFVGWNKHDSGIVGDVLEKLGGDLSRNDLDLLFVAGRQFGDVGRFYVGGRYMYSAWKLEVVPDLPIVYDSGEVQERLLGTDTEGGVHQVGAVVGGALGYRYAFVGAELNVVRYDGKAEIFFKERDLRGFAFMPALYVYGQY